MSAIEVGTGIAIGAIGTFAWLKIKTLERAIIALASGENEEAVIVLSSGEFDVEHDHDDDDDESEDIAKKNFKFGFHRS